MRLETDSLSSGHGPPDPIGWWVPASLLAFEAMRAVKIILCINTSRLSRNSKDWANRFELCGHFETLIADLDRVYDLSFPNDRLVLGIKGRSR